MLNGDCYLNGSCSSLLYIQGIWGLQGLRLNQSKMLWKCRFWLSGLGDALCFTISRSCPCCWWPDHTWNSKRLVPRVLSKPCLTGSSSCGNFPVTFLSGSQQFAWSQPQFLLSSGKRTQKMLRIHQQARQCPGLVFDLHLIACRRAEWTTLGFCRARTGTSL